MPKWTRPTYAPAPLFANKPERDFQKQLVDEITEFVLPGKVLYYAVDRERTNFHPLYGEAIEKFYLSPVLVPVFVDYEDNTTVTNKYGKDRKSKITVHFHKRRIEEDKNLYVREGDIVYYNNEYHEIKKLSEPEPMWDQIEHQVGITAICEKTRNPPVVTGIK
jgi:hypothetical protein